MKVVFKFFDKNIQNIICISFAAVAALSLFGAWKIWDIYLAKKGDIAYTQGTIIGYEKGEKSTGKGVGVSITRRVYFWKVEYKLPNRSEPLHIIVSEDDLSSDKQSLGATVTVRYHVNGQDGAEVHDEQAWEIAFRILLGLGLAAAIISLIPLMRR